MPKGDIYKVMPKLKQIYTLFFLLIVLDKKTNKRGIKNDNETRARLLIPYTFMALFAIACINNKNNE